MKTRTILLGLVCLIVVFWMASISQGTVKLIQSAPHYMGLSTDTKPSGTTVTTGATFYESDTGRSLTWNGSAWAVMGNVSIVGDSTGASLTSTGTTDAIYVRGFNIAGFFFEITKINTSVTIGLQSKVGTSGWTNHDAAPTVYTSNANEGLVSSNIAYVDSMRLNFSAEVGGTDAIITNIVPTRGNE